MSTTELSVHDVARIEVKPMKHLLLSSAGDTFPCQHVWLHLGDGSRVELTLFLTNDAIPLTQLETP